MSNDLPQPTRHVLKKVGFSIHSRHGRVPSTGLLVLSIFSTQIGAALAKGLFSSVGPVGAVALRVGFSAILLLLVARPRVAGYSRPTYLNIVLFGVALAAMNLCFYSALAHIPLGVAVTLEFVGPLSVSISGSRRFITVLWVILAACGIAALAPWTGATYNLLGMILALVAGGCWAAYIIFSSRVGRSVAGINGLALAMGVASILLIPVGIVVTGVHLFHPTTLLVGLGVALLSSVIPYSLEIEALRRLSTRVFGLLMSMEPAIATLVGLVLLGERIGIRSFVSIVLITIAIIGTLRGESRPTESTSAS